GSLAIRGLNLVQGIGGTFNFVENLQKENYWTAALDALGVVGNVAQVLRACFAAGTPLLTPEGSKPIEEFRVGDLVLSRSEYHPYFVGSSVAWGFSIWAHNAYASDLENMALKGWKKGKGGPHLAKHAAEMGFNSVAEYTNAAKAFAKATGSTFTTSKIGNTFF